MKHIIIYLVIAACIFGLMGRYFAQYDDKNNNTDNSAVMVEANAVQTDTVQMGVLFSSIEDTEKVAFVDSMSRQLGRSAEITTEEYGDDTATQLNYYKKLLAAGCRYLFVEGEQADNVDEMITLAAKQGTVLVLMGYTPTEEQFAAYDKLYTIGSNESSVTTDAANTLSSYWITNEEQMDYKLKNGVLNYAVVSDSGFADTEEQVEFERLMEERGCTVELVRDTVTEYLNYNYEYALDRIYFSGAEVILFTDSADAEKAYRYYHDPSQYTTETPKLCVLEVDETVYELQQSGKILFACGNGGAVMGRMAANMVLTLMREEALSYSNVGVAPTNNGRTFLCNDTILRNIIVIPQEPETDE